MSLSDEIIYADELSDNDKKTAFKILRDNANQNTNSITKDNGGFTFIVKDTEGQTKAVIAGYCYYGCCYIDLLVVEQKYRGLGVGSRLVCKVQELARKRKCLFMAVNTMDFEA